MNTMQSNWKTQINILCIGQAILMIVLAMSLPYWPLYVKQLGAFTPSQVRFWSAAIYSAPFVSTILFSPIWGRFADNHGHKAMVIRACIGLLITQSLLMFVTNVFCIFGIRFLQGALAGFIAAAQSWALTLSPDTERGVVIGKLQSSVAVGNLFGPFLGGLIATYFGYKSIFGVSAGICFIMLCVFYIVLQECHSTSKNTIESQNPNQHRRFRSFSFLKNTMLSILFVIVLTQIAQSMITPLFALFVTEKLAGSEVTIGLLSAGSGFVMLISAPIIGRLIDHFANKQKKIPIFAIILLILGGILQIVHAYANSITTIFVIRVLWGLCLGGILPILTRMIVDHASNEYRGLAIGLGNSANRFGVLIGVILGAFIEAQFGFRSSFLFNSALYFFSAFIVFMQIKSFYFDIERYSFEN